ncbi:MULTISPECIES: cytochrome d ubiquinol oxidase subunit II [Pelosinus]|uniref:Cytochrome d ubiquinol oxidase, subunit II n=1 Tax=Pelosinus fermentans B4 TaxID=1149862 RepID=I8RAB9_9FIRM|nr:MULTISPECIES: cytochrome d ubiquinol oxidase subunit II [Pelosinus]EIW15813.1 cytochrome d ubiquinol oxidase, subunit II [Pelosinus fermentans B4]EIW27481.1 cytochrome d ubiquinol oxidase, subunit II [Pelosinus fermentans A11]OAM92561.1 cytochrome d ubiquinol oxidase, subunit II [Pelosinus fermentans DSM 17108]SDQ49002.1 cytochrome bd-I ubiquinol oxidase subunit 2 apoprotein [Pelosinus fermentans]
MELNILWFILVGVLFTGFFFLEGFDYGVGMLLPFIGRNDVERRIVINTIGPFWDGNEVWMITAGGALFAAFPHVYATMFSGFYMALFLMLVALILRGVAIEFRSKDESSKWRSTWDWMIFIGSTLPALLWGVAVTNLIQGIPINSKMQYAGTFFDLLSPYTLVGGVAFLLVFLFHGALFLTLRVEGELIERSRKAAVKIGLLAALVFLSLVGLTYTNTDLFKSALASSALWGAVAVFVAGYVLLWLKRFGWAFAMSGLAIAFTTIAFFSGLFPRIMVSSINPAWSLTIHNAASSAYTLKIMSFAALALVPIVLAYQGWTYWVFRKRVTAKELEY